MTKRRINITESELRDIIRQTLCESIEEGEMWDRFKSGVNKHGDALRKIAIGIITAAVMGGSACMIYKSAQMNGFRDGDEAYREAVAMYGLYLNGPTDDMVIELCQERGTDPNNPQDYNNARNYLWDVIKDKYGEEYEKNFY